MQKSHALICSRSLQVYPAWHNNPKHAAGHKNVKRMTPQRPAHSTCERTPIALRSALKAPRRRSGDAALMPEASFRGGSLRPGPPWRTAYSLCSLDKPITQFVLRKAALSTLSVFLKACSDVCDSGSSLHYFGFFFQSLCFLVSQQLHRSYCQMSGLESCSQPVQELGPVSSGCLVFTCFRYSSTRVKVGWSSTCV